MKLFVTHNDTLAETIASYPEYPEWSEYIRSEKWQWRYVYTTQIGGNKFILYNEADSQRVCVCQWDEKEKFPKTIYTGSLPLTEVKTHFLSYIIDWMIL